MQFVGDDPVLARPVVPGEAEPHQGVQRVFAEEACRSCVGDGPEFRQHDERVPLLVLEACELRFRQVVHARGDAGDAKGEDAAGEVELPARLERVLREFVDEPRRTVAEADDHGLRHVVEHRIVGCRVGERRGFEAVEGREVDAGECAAAPDGEEAVCGLVGPPLQAGALLFQGDQGDLVT